jgi:hypothetical protein
MTTSSSEVVRLMAALKSKCYNDDLLEALADCLIINDSRRASTNASVVANDIRRQFAEEVDECAQLLACTKKMIRTEIAQHLHGISIRASFPHGMMVPLSEKSEEALVILHRDLEVFIQQFSRILLNGIYRTPEDTLQISDGMRFSLPKGTPSAQIDGPNINGEKALHRDARALGIVLGGTVEFGVVTHIPERFTDSASIALESQERLWSLALQFLVNHEAAHYLEGHHKAALQSSAAGSGGAKALFYRHWQEADADMVAAKMLLEQVTTKDGFADGAEAFCGAFVALTALSLLERFNYRRPRSRATHPPAIERLVRIENFLLNRAVLRSRWHSTAIAVRQRFWLLQDAMVDNGYYLSPFEQIIGTQLPVLQLLESQHINESIGSIIGALIFGNYEDVVAGLGAMLADAERWKEQEGAAAFYARVQAVYGALTEELSRRGAAASSVLDDVRTAIAKHKLLHESGDQYDEIFEDCVLPGFVRSKV